MSRHSLLDNIKEMHSNVQHNAIINPLYHDIENLSICNYDYAVSIMHPTTKKPRIYTVVLLYFSLRFSAFYPIGNDEVGSSSLPSSSIMDKPLNLRI